LSGDIKNVIDWFTSGLRLTGPNENIEPVGHMLSSSDDFRKFAGDFLSASSTGVDALDVDKIEVSEDDLEKIVPKSLFSTLLKDLHSSPDGISVVQFPEGTEIIFERTDANHYYRVTIHAAHKVLGQGTAQLPLSEESDGTRRLLQLLPALHLTKAGEATYFIDEIDRSMHPMLIWRFIQFFLSACHGKETQLIVSTHESNLLDLELLRRDEIWFVEKDSSSISKLYALSDFKVRKDLEIRKHYLQGRFGAVPFLGRLDGLMEESEECP
jgi:AAA15 family ATPase/GTPase